LHNASLSELSAALAARRISSVELTQLFLERIAKHNSALNAFITVHSGKSLAQARAADARLAQGEGGPLTGIPIAHKDIFCAKGWLTTCGSKMLSGFVAPYDAHVIERLNLAGAVMLGKTNMDEFAMGSSNENSFYGAARNPWDAERVPGGSSGGSAAAVAARLAPAATGTDTGGSIRQPAAHTGITGLKPTYGRVSRYGMIAYASSLDQGGVMARSAEDVALLLAAIAGFDERDSTSVDRAVENYPQEVARPWNGAPASRPLEGLRLGVPREHFGAGLDQDVAGAVTGAIAELEKLGARRVDVSLPNARLSVPAYYVIAPAEASSNLARYDGVRYGYRAPRYEDLSDMYCKTRAQGFGDEVKRRILVGTYVLSHGYYDAYYLQAQRVRRLIARDYGDAFGQCDLVVGPAAPSVAFGLGEKTADPVQMYLSDIYTTPANLAGLPALSVPCGFGAGGMPVGLHVTGEHFSESRLLSVAHHFQRATGWHVRCPGKFS
jgi:aspartyl-tRNA(Asn)/glutamyl-tRNA(Gln) amidotransferase subunit A